MVRQSPAWLLGALLMCALWCTAAVGAEVPVVATGSDLDPEADPEYFAREEDVPEGLPPLQEEHTYFESLDLDKGTASLLKESCLRRRLTFLRVNASHSP